MDLAVLSTTFFYNWLKVFEMNSGQSGQGSVIILMQLYEIGKLLGTGSSGEVLLCKHKKENKDYALKRIRLFETESKEKENIENELRLLQKLRHPNIVSFKDSFTDKEGNLCIVMAYCETGDMQTKIRKAREKGKAFSEQQILDWIGQTALAIHYLHRQQILHRDLKSQNLFLKEWGNQERIKLGDFGISKMLDTAQDLTQTCIGTPMYMAPEVFKNKPYSYKSDIWSLGIVFYEMCNLRLPFEANSYNALGIKVLKKSYPAINTTYSKPLKILIAQMLNKKPQHRPTIKEIINKPFIKARIQKYIANLLSKNGNGLDADEVYLDSLKEQIILLGLSLGEDDGIRKYPSSKELKDCERKLARHRLRKNGNDEEEEAMKEYHSKRRSTFDRNSYSLQKNNKREDSNSQKIFLNRFNNITDENQAFVDRNRPIMMDKQQHKAALESKRLLNRPFEVLHRQSARGLRIREEYTMEDEADHLEPPIEEEIIQEDSDEDSVGLRLDQDEEVPESYNKSYYKLYQQIKVLKHMCESVLGGNKYLRAYNAVNNGSNKAAMLQILGQKMIGYWHLIDQIMFYESILKTIPKQ